MVVELNAWLAKKYNQGNPKVHSAEFYRRIFFERSGSRKWCPVPRKELLEKYGLSHNRKSQRSLIRQLGKELDKKGPVL